MSYEKPTMNRVQAAAMFILGYTAAAKPRTGPKKVALERAAQVAAQIIYEGGAFNPRAVFQMEEYAQVLGFKRPPEKMP